MNKKQIATMQGKNLRIWPIARRTDPTRGELPQINDLWHTRSASQEEIELHNHRTGHILQLGTDHIREFLSDPEGADGILRLKTQIELRGTQIYFHPLL